jgi:hypothetical protein
MGRYISTGIIYQYRFAKASIPGIATKNVKQQVINQLFPQIYDCLEDDKYLYFVLSSKIPVSELISLMEIYNGLRGMRVKDIEEFERVKQLLEGKTLEEAYELAETKPSYLYQADNLGPGCGYYAVPLMIDGKRKLYPVYVWCIMIENSCVKTITEDHLVSYDFFTDLLRYRMRPAKLADAMLIYLSE